MDSVYRRIAARIIEQALMDARGCRSVPDHVVNDARHFLFHSDWFLAVAELAGVNGTYLREKLRKERRYCA